MRGFSAIAAGGLTLALSLSVAYANGESINGFPNWEERVMLEWTNRARAEPSVELQSCVTSGACPEAASGTCYTPIAPALWNEKLNHAARFHSDEMAKQGYFGHDSQCTLVANINTIYPGTCDGDESCACMGGTVSCTGSCTAWNARVSLFGQGTNGEIIASGGDPNGAFYQWLNESYNKSGCGYDMGPPTNGHRWHLLKTGPSVGFGRGAGASVGDFGSGGTMEKIPSGAHYPRQGASVDAWANWYDTAGPMSALVNVEGTCTAMTKQRGTVMNGAYKATLTGVGSGCHRYFFLFKDSGGNIVTYPTTGSLGIGPSTTCPDWDATRPATGAGCDCTPQCSGKTCGDDGCGGSCGNCAGGQTCEEPAGTCTGAGGGDGGNGNNGDGGMDPGGSDGGGCCSSTQSPSSLAVLALLCAIVLFVGTGRRRRR